MRSVSKKRHIFESNLRLEKRFLKEDEEELWLSVVNNIGKDKFVVHPLSARKILPDKTVIAIGKSPKGFGVSVDLPEGKIESELTKEMLRFGNGGWATSIGSYNWNELNQTHIDEVSNILKKYII